MPARLKELERKGLVRSPTFLSESIQYEVYMGSLAYGCSNDASDMDCYGWAIGPKSSIFPHTSGYLHGFDPLPQGFKVYTEHHIIEKDAMGGVGREYDYSIYNITNFFNLVADNNPNMLDTLWVPERCILFQTPLGMLVRENRKLFISQKLLHTFRGYAHQQLHKLRIKEPSESSKRRETIDKYGYDTKVAYHIVRLLEECKMLLEEGDMDLERNREIYKAIRAGLWTLGDIESYFKSEESRVLDMAQKSKLPHKPDREKVKALLLECLERHFITLDGCIETEEKSVTCLNQIEELIYNYRRS